MGDTVFVNGRAAIHKGSMGKAIATFPDVCNCPPSPPAGPVPTPLPNTVMARDLKDGASSVFIEGNPMAIETSYIGSSTGNEVAQATGGGLVTGVVRGKAYFASYSMDVLVEGKPVPRHMDLLTQNHASPPGNTPPALWMSTTAVSAMGPSTTKTMTMTMTNESQHWHGVTMVIDAHLQPTTMSGLRLRTTFGGGLERTHPVARMWIWTKIPEGEIQIHFDEILQLVEQARAELRGA